MTDDERLQGPRQPLHIDTSVAHSARFWNYLLGGKDNYAVDRAAAEQILALIPSLRDTVRAERSFLIRTVEHLVADAGIRQFLDIGTGLPTVNNTHEVAQATAPDCRVVYVDNDPMIMAHARALLAKLPRVPPTTSTLICVTPTRSCGKPPEPWTSPIRLASCCWGS